MANILIIGAGKMGSALVTSWAKLGEHALAVVEPDELLNTTASEICPTFRGIEELPGDLWFDVVVIATKPQNVCKVAADCNKNLRPDGFIISIAAGVSLESIATAAGADRAIVRAMPNLPVLIGEGMVVCCANNTADAQQLRLCERLFGSVGKVAFSDETVLDAVTAVSGSGPAYVFSFLEALHDAAMSVGLENGLALMLVKQTVYGAAKMALLDHASLSLLRKMVTSPAGTTEAGLMVLSGENSDLRGILNGAVQAAAYRSKELGSQ